MRKFLSLLLMTAMLIVPTSVFADTVYEADTYATAVNPSFDADFSTFSADEKISDKSSNKYSVVTNGLEKADGKTQTIGTNKVDYIHFGGNKVEATDVLTNFKIDTANFSNLDNITLEFWTKPDLYNAETNEKVLFALTKSTKALATFDAYMKEAENSKSLTVRLDNNDEKTQSVDITDCMGKWTHFVFVRSFDSENSAATVKVYINGEEKIDETFSETTKQDESEKFLFVGCYNGNKNTNKKYAYKGDISEVRVYNEALGVENVNRNYITQGAKYVVPETEEPDPDQPVNPDIPATEDSDLLFDLSVGDTVADIKDASGNNIEVTTYGDVSINKYAGGKGDINYVKTSGHQYISFTDSSLLNREETTVEFYMLTPEFKSYPHPFTLGTSASDFSFDFEMTLHGTYDEGSVFVGSKDDSHRFGTATGIKAMLSSGMGTINSNQWTHVVITRELNSENQTANLNVYLNGKLFISKTVTGSYVTDKDSTAYYFGSANRRNQVDPGNYYTGGFSEIKVYKKILSENEIKANLEKNVSKYSQTVLTNSETFDRNTSSLSFALNGVDLSNGYEFSFKDVNDSDKTISGTTTKTDSGFDIAFGQYFRYGQEIQFTLTTKDNSGNDLKTFITKTVSKGDSEVEVAVVGEKGEVTKPDGSDDYIIDITVDNKGSDSVDYKYVMVAKNEKDGAIACKNGTFSVSAGGQHTEFDILTDTKNAKEITVYVWENKGGMLVPIYGMPLILK